MDKIKEKVLHEINDDLAKINDIHHLKKECYVKYLDKVKVNENLFNIIKGIKGEYKIALVTTASKKNTMDLLNYTNKADLFDLIITAEDVTKTKPDPMAFNKAIAYFKAPIKDTIIFEDSPVGIAAARKTGANVFIVDKFNQ